MTQQENLALESFICMCDDMQVAEEGFAQKPYLINAYIECDSYVDKSNYIKGYRSWQYSNDKVKEVCRWDRSPESIRACKMYIKSYKENKVRYVATDLLKSIYVLNLSLKEVLLLTKDSVLTESKLNNYLEDCSAENIKKYLDMELRTISQDGGGNYMLLDKNGNVYDGFHEEYLEKSISDPIKFNNLIKKIDDLVNIKTDGLVKV